MKNREKFAKEILDVACKGDTIAVTQENKVVCCGDINCIQCLFGKKDNYVYYCDDEKRMQWSESEYVEKPTITSREKNFLDLLLPKWKYIARDNNNELYIYNEKPTRRDCDWYLNDGIFCRISTMFFGNMFDFIKWEDEKPWSIEDLKKLEVKDE